MRNRLKLAVMLALLLLPATVAPPAPAQSAAAPSAAAAAIPVITVTGHGQVDADPDQAVLTLGASVQAERAGDAQTQMAKIMDNVIKAVKTQGVAEKDIKTARLTMTPVYDYSTPATTADRRIIGYRADNTVRVQIEDFQRIAPIIDSGIAAGANVVGSLAFQIKKDTAQRKQALQDAMIEAREKAEVMADAMRVRLDGVQEAVENGVSVIRPTIMMGAGGGIAGGARGGRGGGAFTPAEPATAVQPGQVRVEATVLLSYRFVPIDPVNRN